MFEISKAQFLKNKLDPSESFRYWFRLSIFLTIVNIAFVIVISKFIIATKIYFPSILIIPQVIYYNLSSIESLSADAFPLYDLPLFVFYFSSCLISVPLLTFSWFKLGKKYTKRSALSTINYLFIAVFFCFREINDASIWNFIEDLDISDTLSERVKDIRFYFIGIFAGAALGVLISLLWKNQISAGGLDYLYTYLAIVKRSNTRKVSIPLNLFFVTLGFVITEIFLEGNGFVLANFILALTVSIIFSYTSLAVVENIYPKFKIVNLWIVTTKSAQIAKELKKHYKHGGTIVKGVGLYDNKNKEIISTAIIAVEKNELTNLIREIDPAAFIIFQPINSIMGKFNYPLI